MTERMEWSEVEWFTFSTTVQFKGIYINFNVQREKNEQREFKMGIFITTNNKLFRASRKIISSSLLYNYTTRINTNMMRE